jgi:hypothetical protein
MTTQDSTNNGLLPATIYFRDTKDKDGKVTQKAHEAVTVQLPLQTANSLYIEFATKTGEVPPYIEQDGAVIENPAFKGSEGEKLLNYFADLFNKSVTQLANAQLREALKNGGADKKLSQADLNLEELTLWANINRPPAERKTKLFSDELVADALADFKSVLATHGKNSKGEPISKQGLEKAAKWAIEDRFANVRNQPVYLLNLQGYLQTWIDNSSKKDIFTPFAEYLLAKADGYLNPAEPPQLNSLD